ncbi:hypothetical protein PTKIN_Ptkin05aG0058100 [Pterospermum kingtungense]
MGEKVRPCKKLKFPVKNDHRSAVVKDECSFNPNEGNGNSCDGEEEGKKGDFSKLELKPNHENRPLWACADGRIYLETFSPLCKQAYDFLIAIAETVCRPESMHEYNLTSHSLYAAVFVGLETETIISMLNKLSKTKLSKEIIDFIRASIANYGKVKLVFKKNSYFIESPFPEVLKKLLQDEVIARARIVSESAHADDGFTINKTTGEIETGHGCLLNEAEVVATAEEKETHAFEIDPSQVENVKQRCLPNALNYPMLEEYDFKNDTVNPDLDMELKPHTLPRPYQEKSLSKMFGNGRARSSIIVLPCGCGARKSLVGDVSTASRIKKSCLCLSTNAVSVDQCKERFHGNVGVVVTTYNMVAFGGMRSEETEKIIEEIRNRERGLLLMDEVHVLLAHMFRKVISLTKSHCKLGLTDNLFALKVCSETAQAYDPCHLERTTLLQTFKTSLEVNTIFLSKVGDNSIDIPEANGKLEDRMAGGKEEYNASFYSLASTDTQMMTNLPPPDAGADLSYHHLDEQLALKDRVVNAGNDAVGLEQLEEDTDYGQEQDLFLAVKQGQNKSRPKDPSKRHYLFKKCYG